MKARDRFPPFYRIQARAAARGKPGRLTYVGKASRLTSSCPVQPEVSRDGLLTSEGAEADTRHLTCGFLHRLTQRHRPAEIRRVVGIPGEALDTW